MGQVIRISKANTNAVTGTAPDNLIFSSDYNTLKYYTSGTINVIRAGTNAEGTVAHNLGYTPFFIAFVNQYAGTADYSMCPGRQAELGIYTHADSYANGTNIYFSIISNIGGTNQVTFTYRYFIFRNNTGL